MRIVGHGIDIVETGRIQQLLDHHRDRFLSRCFTDSERGYAHQRRRGIEHLAGRFAAKEAVFKVLGTGWGQGVGWTDVEILRHPSGQPYICMHGKGKQIAHQLGIDQWSISITHITTHALASAIGIETGNHPDR